MSKPRAAGPLLLIVLVVAVAGCGGSGSTSSTFSSAEQAKYFREEMDEAEAHSENRIACVLLREIEDGEGHRSSMYANVGPACRSYREHHKRFLEHYEQ